MAKTFPKDDPRAAYVATDTVVDRAGLDDTIRHRHRWVLATTRSDGRPQMSLVTGGLLPDGRLAIATYPMRAKARNGWTWGEMLVSPVGARGFRDLFVVVLLLLQKWIPRVCVLALGKLYTNPAAS